MKKLLIVLIVLAAGVVVIGVAIRKKAGRTEPVLATEVPTTTKASGQSADSTPPITTPVAGNQSALALASTNAPAAAPAGLANFDQGVAALANRNLQNKERLKSLHALFARRSEMSDEQVRGFWRTLRSVAQEKSDDPKFTADTIWAMGDVGVLARLRGVMTEEEVAQEARFLLDLAQNKATDPIIQRVAVAALGDLRVMEAAPWLEQLVRSPGADVQPNVLRSAAIALPKLTGTKAVAPLSQLLSTTDNKDVFGTAAYALGTVGAPEALPTLVANRLRLGDNLSVDNAINGMSSNVIAVLSRPSDPQITDAIAATRSLWREEQQKEYLPLLQNLVQDQSNAVAVRQAALQRLFDHAAHLPFEQEKAQLATVLPSIQQQPEFQKETEYINMRLNAQVLTPTRIEP
jgi:HEAT repeat protein